MKIRMAMSTKATTTTIQMMIRTMKIPATSRASISTSSHSILSWSLRIVSCLYLCLPPPTSKLLAPRPSLPQNRIPAQSRSHELDHPLLGITVKGQRGNAPPQLAKPIRGKPPLPLPGRVVPPLHPPHQSGFR